MLNPLRLHVWPTLIWPSFWCSSSWYQEAKSHICGTWQWCPVELVRISVCHQEISIQYLHVHQKKTLGSACLQLLSNTQWWCRLPFRKPLHPSVPRDAVFEWHLPVISDLSHLQHQFKQCGGMSNHGHLQNELHQLFFFLSTQYTFPLFCYWYFPESAHSNIIVITIN